MNVVVNDTSYTIDDMCVVAITLIQTIIECLEVSEDEKAHLKINRAYASIDSLKKLCNVR